MEATEKPTKENKQAESPGNETWEANHSLIINAMIQIIRQEERMPTKSEIARLTGLSRPTVIKHLKEFKTNALAETQTEMLHAMGSKVVATVLQIATTGDMKAAHLALEMMGIAKSRAEK